LNLIANATLNRGRSKVTKNCKKVFSVLAGNWGKFGSQGVESLDAAIDKYVSENMQAKLKTILAKKKTKRK